MCVCVCVCCPGACSLQYAYYMYLLGLYTTCIWTHTHKQVHYIEKNWGKVNDDFRIVLKVHHVVYPAWAVLFGKLLGWLSTRYNRAFRSLFLYTINPDGAFNKFAAWNVIFWTKVVHQLEEKVGYSNIGYFAILGVVAALTDYKVFRILILIKTCVCV